MPCRGRRPAGSSSSSSLSQHAPVQPLLLHVAPPTQVVKLCRECLQKQDGVLADTHLYRLRVLSVASEALSYLQRFSEAADHAHKMVEGYL